MCESITNGYTSIVLTNSSYETEEGAEAYLPRAREFIRGNFMISSDERWRNYARSTPFDFDSIMIYDSDTNWKARPGKPGSYLWVIYKSDTNAKQRSVWMGGKRDGTGGISQGDIARVAQLYPLPDGANIKAQNLEEWRQTEEVDDYGSDPWES